MVTCHAHITQEVIDGVSERLQRRRLRRRQAPDAKYEPSEREAAGSPGAVPRLVAAVNLEAMLDRRAAEQDAAPTGFARLLR